jgi:hypothetical protein
MNLKKTSRIEGIKARLQSIQEQKKIKEESNAQLQDFLSALTPAIQQFHTRIGYRDSYSSKLDAEKKKKKKKNISKIVCR